MDGPGSRRMILEWCRTSSVFFDRRTRDGTATALWFPLASLLAVFLAVFLPVSRLPDAVPRSLSLSVALCSLCIFTFVRRRVQLKQNAVPKTRRNSGGAETIHRIPSSGTAERSGCESFLVVDCAGCVFGGTRLGWIRHSRMSELDVRFRSLALDIRSLCTVQGLALTSFARGRDFRGHEDPVPVMRRTPSCPGVPE